jgi:hypothetical protein
MKDTAPSGGRPAPIAALTRNLGMTTGDFHGVVRWQRSSGSKILSLRRVQDCGSQEQHSLQISSFKGIEAFAATPGANVQQMTQNRMTDE